MYRLNKDPVVLNKIRHVRNKVNALVDKPKTEYIKKLLGSTKNDPKKC